MDMTGMMEMMQSSQADMAALMADLPAPMAARMQEMQGRMDAMMPMSGTMPMAAPCQ